MADNRMVRGLVGAMALVCAPSLAFAAPKAAATGGSGGASSVTTPAGGTAGATPTDPTPATTSPPADTTAPPAPEAAPAAPEPPAAAPAAEDEDARPAPRRKKKKKRRHVDDDMDESSEGDERWTSASEDSESEAGPAVAGWRASSTSFIVSGERLTSITSWSNTTSVETTSFGFGSSSSTSKIDLESSGTTVAFLGNMPISNPYALPRIAIDGRFSNGFTIGGSVSYIALSSKNDTLISNGSSSPNKESRSAPDESFFVFAPRLGVFFEASPTVSVWLRGGVTRVSASGGGPTVSNPQTGAIQTSTITVTAVAVTLDPQLVFTPVPHVGITLGAALDIGATGSIETAVNGGSSTSTDYTASSYGATAGLALLF